MEIKVAKIITGEDVVAKVEEIDGAVRFESPLQFAIAPNGEGGVGLEFGPWPMYGDVGEEGIEIKKSMIVYMVKPDETILNGYKEVIGDIIVPDSDIII